MVRRRFIAGAECPYCRQVDRMVIEFDAEHRIMTRQCLSCGRADQLPETPSLADQPPGEADVLPIRFDG